MRGFSGEDRIARQIDAEGVKDGYVRMKSGVPFKILMTVLTFIVGILIVLLIWQVMGWYVNEIMDVTLKFPYPSESIGWVMGAFIEESPIYGATIIQHLIGSLRRVGIAFLLASLFGITLGITLGYYNRLYSVGIIPVMVFQSIPGLAWVPISLLLFSKMGGEAIAIFIIFAVSSMVIIINVSGGIRTLPEVVTRAAGMMGAKGIILFVKILIPYSSIAIINGLRLGLGSAWRVLIAAEMLLGTTIGLGASMELLRDSLDFVGAFGCIVIIAIVGLLLDKVLFSAIEKSMRHRLGMEEGF